MSESRFSTLRAPLCGSASLAATIALISLGASAARAQTVYLVGAVLYASSSNGTDTTPQNYQYDTNTNSSDSALILNYNSVNYAKGIAIPLTTGVNNFTINPTTGISADPGAYSGLGLFFSSSATQYNPSSNARTPDLSFATATASPASANFTPASGTNVANYVYFGTSPANGLTSYTLGSQSVTVSNFLATHNATGSFVVSVGSAAAPEPGSIALAGACLLPLAGYAARRRRTADRLLPTT